MISPHAKAQLGRWVRLLGFSLAAAAAAVPAVQAWEVRYPLLGALIGALEVAYRSAVPVKPVAAVTSEPAPPTPAPPGSI